MGNSARHSGPSGRQWLRQDPGHHGRPAPSRYRRRWSLLGSRASEFRDGLQQLRACCPHPAQLQPQQQTPRPPTTHHNPPTMVGKVSERVLAREGECRCTVTVQCQCPYTFASHFAPLLTRCPIPRPRAHRQWHEADELARCRAHQPEKLLYVCQSTFPRG